MIRACTLAIAIAIAGGCSAYRPPTLTVRKATIADATEEGVVIRFTLDAENANQVELPLKSVTYRLSLNGREVFRGVRSPESTLRRLGTQPITLPTVVRFEDETNVLNPPIKYRLEGTLTYITPGSVAEILFDAGVRVPKVRFADSGILELEPEEPSEQLNPGTVGLGDSEVDSDEVVDEPVPESP